jgi:hypothetical protein
MKYLKIYLENLKWKISSNYQIYKIKRFIRRIIHKILSFSFKIKKTIYVDGSNQENYISNGSIKKPFKQIQEAVNLVAELRKKKINKIFFKYEIMILPSTYNGDIKFSDIQDLILIGSSTDIKPKVNGDIFMEENSNVGIVNLELDVAFKSEYENE